MFPPEQYIAINCSWVQTESGPCLAQVSLTDYRGNVLLDSYCLPSSDVTDYRTEATGVDVRQINSAAAQPLHSLQAQVALLVRGKVLIGYCLWIDLSLLGFTHKAVDTRDVALFIPFRLAVPSEGEDVPPLATLVSTLMVRRITGSNTLENARAALDLFRSSQGKWEDAMVASQWPCALPPTSYAHHYS